MWIARAGITAPLPPEWKPMYRNLPVFHKMLFYSFFFFSQTNDNDLYFCNSKTGETSWEHPSDDKYRQMVLEERQSSALKNQIGSKSLKRENNIAPSSNTLNKVFLCMFFDGVKLIGSIFVLGSTKFAFDIYKYPWQTWCKIGTSGPDTRNHSGTFLLFNSENIRYKYIFLQNSAPPRVLGKLEPLGGSNKDPPPKFTPTPPKPSPQNSNPSANKPQPAERPRTSRGTNDRSNVQSEPPPVQREARETVNSFLFSFSIIPLRH